MTDLLQFAESGVTQGCLYVLVGLGYVAIFSVSGVVNLAQGEFASLGAMLTITAIAIGLPLPLAVGLALIAIGLLAFLIDKMALSPVPKMNTLRSILITLGISIALKAIMLLVWGPDGKSLAPLTGANFTILGVLVPSQHIWIVAITAAFVGLLFCFYERTLVGKALRACADQPVAAKLVGISLKRASAVSFVIAGLTAAAAGILISPIAFTAWDSGLMLGIKGFVAAALGGLVSIRGVVLGGLALGVLESLVAGYLDSGLKDAVAMTVLIVGLIVLPAGLFSKQAHSRV